MAETVTINGNPLSGRLVDYRDDRVRALQDESTLHADREAAFTSIVREIGPSVSRYVGSLLTCDPQRGVDDATQEIMLKVWMGIGGFNGEANLRTWVYKIAKNYLIDEARRVKRSPFLVHGLNDQASYDRLLPGSESQYANPDQDAEFNERFEKIMAALVDLPEDLKGPVVLKVFADLSYQEIADILGISHPTVKSRIHDGRRTIKEQLGQAVPQAIGGIATQVELLSPA